MTHESVISFTDPAKLQKSLNLLANGSDKAFRMLYMTFRPRLVAYVARSGLSDHDAEVVADDTLMDFCGKAVQFAVPAGDDKMPEVRSYLFGMARNKANSLWRKVYAHSERVQEDPEDALTNAMVDESMDVVRTMTVDQDKEAVNHCLERLSFEQRDAIVLVYWEGLSMDEVAKVQGRAVGTVKSRMFNAKEKLKKCFETWINGGRYGR